MTSVLQAMREDTVADLHLGDPITIEIGATVGETIALLQKRRRGSLMVVDRGRLAGVCTERDVVKKILRHNRPLSTPVRDVMTENPVTLRRSDLAEKALHLFHEGGFRHIPVVDEKGRPIGMLSVKSMVNHLVELYPNAIYNLPPDPSRISTEMESG